ncbi:hypothetical protein J6E39_02665 [bacterium]|nr:hypothetical protein [bacterium]
MEFNATFIVSAISFVIFTVIMNAVFYRPIERIVNERQKFIDDAYSDAKNSNEKADGLIQDKEYRLAETDKTTKNIMTEIVTSANKMRDEKISEARNSAKSRIDEAKLSLSHEKNNMTDRINAVTVELAESISSKILGENVKISDGELISRVIK